MKPLLFRIPMTEKESFNVQHDLLPHFYDALHYHPEIQITYIVKSTGTIFIGDRIEQFSGGEIYIMGANLPHMFRNDNKFYQNDEIEVEGISIYFKQEAMGENFFQLPETHMISELLRKSSRGIKVTGATRDRVLPMMHQMIESNGVERIITLLSILDILSRGEKDLEFLSSFSFSSPLKEADSKKINDVFEYVMENFSREISLQEIAELANMSPTAFCRYFKHRTRKTFSKFLNEIRIGHACKLLLESRSLNVTEISFECGFNNISNFNRQFKKITNYTPTQYLRKYRS